MRSLKNLLRITCLVFLTTLLSGCEKQDSFLKDASGFDNKFDYNTSVSDQSITDQINNLQALVEKIESMAEDRILNKGNANALIVKIKNAIKSLKKGNTGAAKNQLNAFINQTETYVRTGKLTVEEGAAFIKAAEYGIMLAEGSFVDPRDGEEYKVVLIGDQLWMAENLRTTKYNDGTDIIHMPGGDEWVNPGEEGYYCWYNNDEDAHKYPYGALYNWYVVETGKLAPVGWHVPSWDEIEILIDFLGGTGVAGGKLKEAKTLHWNAPNTGATNESGFTALPGGVMNTDVPASIPYAQFNNMGVSGCIWSTSKFSYAARYLVLSYNGAHTGYGQYSNSLGYSVRCVKDLGPLP